MFESDSRIKNYCYRSIAYILECYCGLSLGVCLFHVLLCVCMGKVGMGGGRVVCVDTEAHPS